MDESYESDIILEDMKRQLIANMPRDVEVTQVDFEGPFIIIYTRQPDVIFEDPESVKNLAKKLRKRIVIRSDPSIRLPAEVAETKIEEIVPEEAEITSMNFDELLGEVVIEAKKPGIVIGQNGDNLRNIAKESFWRPKVVRTLPTQSSIISKIRNINQSESAIRRKNLLKIGKRIHRPIVLDDGTIRVTNLGGAGEVGRSSILISTTESRVLVDCGLAVGNTNPKRMFPKLSAPEFDLENLDAVIVTHAHLDHCLPPKTPVLLPNGTTKHIEKIKQGDKVLSFNWETGDYETAECTGKTTTKGHKKVVEIRTPYLTIRSSPNHRFFKIENLDVVEVEARDLEVNSLLPTIRPEFTKLEDNSNELKPLERSIEYAGSFPLSKEMQKELIALRKKSGLLMKTLAKKIGVHPNAISLYESKKKNISYSVLRKIVSYYKLNWDDFVNKHALPSLPSHLTPELAQLVGYIQGDGFKATEHSLRIVEPDKSVINVYKNNILSNFSIKPTINQRKDTITPTYHIEVYNSYIVRFLEKNFNTIFSKSRKIEVPAILDQVHPDVICGYIKGLFDAEGTVILSSKTVGFCSFSKKLLKKLQILLYRLDIASSMNLKDKTLKISSYQDILQFSQRIGFSSTKKQHKLEKLLSNLSKNSLYYLRDLIPITWKDLDRILKSIGYLDRINNSPRIKELPSAIVDWYNRKSGFATRATIKKLVDVLEQRYNELNQISSDISSNLLIARQKLSIPRAHVSSSLNLSMMQVQYREEMKYEDEHSERMVVYFREYITQTQDFILETMAKIRKILAMKVEWQKITSLKNIENKQELIDIEVNPNQNFIANGIIVHNSGLVPYLFKYGYEGPVYCNDPTLSLMTLLQRDYLKIAELENKLVPYASKDIVNMILHTITRRYNEVTDITGDIRLTFSPAGHILGSSVAHLHIGNGQYNIAIANDFRNSRSTVLSSANSRFPRLEAMILESTFGSPKDKLPPQRDAERHLYKILSNTLNNGGKVLIPTLAVGVAQELIVLISNLIESKQLPSVPVYLDGMISEATAIYSSYPEYLSRGLQNKIFSEGENPFLRDCFEKVEGRAAREEVVSRGPAIIIATSGMLTGGASVDYFHKLAGDERNAIVFISYQSEHSLGRRVASGAKEIRYYSGGRMRMTRVNMEVHTVEGFSGHSDYRGILNYVGRLSPRPRRIILNHGQERKANMLGRAIKRRYKIQVDVPMNLETLRLD